MGQNEFEVNLRLSPCSGTEQEIWQGVISIRSMPRIGESFRLGFPDSVIGTVTGVEHSSSRAPWIYIEVAPGMITTVLESEAGGEWRVVGLTK